MKDKIEQILDRFRSPMDGELSIYSMADYIFELETKLQNTSSNSDYAKCEHKNVSWADDKWFCEDCKRPVIVTAHFA